MKILFLTNIPVGQIEKSQAYKENRISPHTLFFGYDYLKKKYGDDIVLVDSIKENIFAKIINRFFHYTIGSNSAALQLKAVISAYKNNVDIIFIHFMNIATLISFLRSIRIIRKPVVVLAHDSFSQRSTRLKVWKGVDKVLTIGEAPLELARIKEDISQINCQYLDWGATISYYDKYYINNKASVNEKFIFSTGVANRDYVTLIEAMRKIPDVKLYILSSFVDISQEERCKLPSNVIIDEKMTRENTAKSLYYYNNCIAVAICLKDQIDWPTGGTIISESMAMRKPILISKSRANLFDVDRLHIGKSIEMGDVKGWINSIKYIRDNENEAKIMGLNGYDIAKKNSNYERFCLELDEELQNINKQNKVN